MAPRSRQKYLEDEIDEDDERPSGLIAAVQSALLRPIQPFISRTALRAYLTTFLVFVTTLVLFGLAVTAYALFYWSYIPRIGFERTIHLQFDNVYRPHDEIHRNVISRTKEHPYPHGTVSLTPDLVGGQGYDVFVELDMPRTMDNREAGNFMLDVTMYSAGTVADQIIDAARSAVVPDSTKDGAVSVIAVSRRPAMVPYRSWVVDAIQTAKSLPWYFFNLKEEKDKLRVPIFERVSFARGTAGLPATLRLEVQSTHRLQIYSAVAHFRARFTGLRWIMYNHRIISAVVFITAFWITELVFFALAWGVVSFYISAQPELGDVKAELPDDTATIKGEEDDSKALSDTERTFPTLGGQAPLRYSAPVNGIKQEPEDEEPALRPVTPAAEADDEDEDVDFFDSGIGTSMESSNPSRRESVRRRRYKA
ncbi:hypothetical protein CERZMDRAFT_100360 [Cercospora zeae-maydis SCOH1-5]|uniref:Seipin n=1 Tax=Cercospora zeae-maydis SCOH1-5 TaxID=717836 RepID=A0A6A6F8K0_9PEZI|nr:hypothetical protein CERZMDRAFT_100360 [Cercospora zeae-maydis SCOH1-5]